MNAVAPAKNSFGQSILTWLRASLTPVSPRQATRATLLDAREIQALAQRAHAIGALGAPRPDVQFRYAGDMRSIHLGQGLDFEESRLYQRGDDLRSMDWRTTARTGKAYVKVFREEHQAAVVFVVDRGATMRFGTQRRLKITQAARLAVFGAFAALRKGTNVGGYVIGTEPVFLPPASGPSAAWRLIGAATEPAPPLAVAQDAFWQRLEALDRLLARGARVVLISDFMHHTAAHAALITRLAQRFELAAVHVFDPAEVELPNIGLARFRNLSAGGGFTLDTADARLRRDYNTSQCQKHDTLRAMFARVGVQLVECPTTLDDLPFSA